MHHHLGTAAELAGGIVLLPRPAADEQLVGFDLRLVGNGIDLEQDVAGLERLVGLDRDLHHLAGDIGHNLHRLADDECRTLRRTPAHWDEKTEHQQEKNDNGRAFPEQIERDDLRLHQDEEDDEIDIEDGDDHRA